MYYNYTSSHEVKNLLAIAKEEFPNTKISE